MIAPRGRWLALGLAALGLAAFAPSASAAFTAPIDVVPANGENPQIATAPNGNSAIVWEFGGTRVQARTLSAAGVLGPVHELGQASGTTDSSPEVAMDTQGDATFVWRRSVPGNFLLVRTLSANGTLGPPQDVGPGGQTGIAPELATDFNGDTTVAFINISNSPDVVQARTISARGVVGPVRTLSPAGQFPDAEAPQVDVDLTGDAVVTWERDGGPAGGGAGDQVQARTMTINGSLGPLLDLSNPATRAAEPQVAVDDDGDATFTWLRFDGIRDRVETRRMNAAGALQAPATVSNTRSAQTPQVATDADGDSVFAWETFDASVDRILARRMTLGGTFAGIQQVSAVGGEAFVPQVASAASGASVFTWLRFDGTADRVQARAMNAAGSLQATFDLSAAGVNGETPQVAMAATTGLAAAVWERAGVIQAAIGP